MFHRYRILILQISKSVRLPEKLSIVVSDESDDYECESVCGRNLKQLEPLYPLSDKPRPDPAELRILPAASRYLDYLNL